MVVSRSIGAAFGLAAAGLLTVACSGSSGSGGPAASSSPSSSAASSPAGAASPTGQAVAPTVGSSVPATGPARCRTAGLRVTLGPPDGTAGSTYRSIIFTNTGGSTCTLRGFPGVSYVAGDDGHQVGPAADWAGPVGNAVRLAPGGRATAQLQLVDVLNYDTAVCRPTPVRGLRIYPPGERAAVFVAAPGTGCAGKLPGFQLSVRAVEQP
jgi:hypothetical protein